VRDLYSRQGGDTIGIAALLPSVPDAAWGKKIRPAEYLELISGFLGRLNLSEVIGSELHEKIGRISFSNGQQVSTERAMIN